MPVSFTTTAGSIASSVVVSDASGEARTTITTNRDATVTATAGGRGGDGGAAITAQTTITAVALPTVSVSVQTTTPTVGAEHGVLGDGRRHGAELDPQRDDRLR